MSKRNDLVGLATVLAISGHPDSATIARDGAMLIDELSDNLTELSDACHAITCERDEARAECAEQCRLLGISGSVEASLRAEIERLRRNAGCARNQGSTQFCAEVDDMRTKARDIARRLRANCPPLILADELERL